MITVNQGNSIFEKNRAVFADTRIQSLDRFAGLTAEMIDKLSVYDDASMIWIDGNFPERDVPMQVEFSDGGTVSTAYKYAAEGFHVAMLNFADALVPGGLVLAGEVTQEENICRCTNLYESLTSEKAKIYYNQNNRYGGSRYTNALIYSPGVVIFKDDITYDMLPEQFAADVITSPAPLGGNTLMMQDLIATRMEGIVKSAIAHGCEVLILGAWGCGAFGQDAVVIARLFANVLNKYRYYFDRVQFAIRSNSGEPSPLRLVFEKAFNEVYDNGSE